MSDPLNGKQMIPEIKDPWKTRVNDILAGVRRESRIYFGLGLCSYIGSGFAIIHAIKEPSLAALLIMGYFQLMVIFFGTMKIYPCIRGGFLVSVEQTYETTGDMKAIREAIERDTTKVPARGAREVFETKP